MLCSTDSSTLLYLRHKFKWNKPYKHPTQIDLSLTKLTKKHCEPNSVLFLLYSFTITTVKKWTVNMTQYKLFFDVHCVRVSVFFVRFIPITSRKMIHGQSRMTLDFQTKHKWVWKKQRNVQHTAHKCFDSKLFWFGCTAVTQDDVTSIFRSWFWCHIRFRIQSTRCSIVVLHLESIDIYSLTSQRCQIRYDRCIVYVLSRHTALLKYRTHTTSCHLESLTSVS